MQDYRKSILSAVKERIEGVNALACSGMSDCAISNPLSNLFDVL